MKKEKQFKFNIYFNKDGEKLEKILIASIINYLKNDIKGLTSEWNYGIIKL